MKLGRSGRLCSAVTAVVATATVVTSVAWVTQTASAVQSDQPQWLTPPPEKVLRPVIGDTTFTVEAAAGTTLTWTGRGASCLKTSGSAAECRVRDRSRGGRMAFIASRPDGSRSTTSTQVLDDVSFVSLGDSYASGEADPPFVTDEYDTTANGCHRSATAATRQLADRARVPAGGSTTFRHVACSGVTIPGLLAGSKGEPGQLARLAATPDVSLVTLSVGGNDVGVGKILTSCLPAAGCQEALAQATRALAAMTTPLPEHGGISLLERTFRAVHEAAPHAHLAVTGYPMLFPPNDPQACAPLGKPATDLINAITLELNRRTELIAQKVPGTTFVDLVEPFAGHAACEQVPARRWLTYVDPVNPTYSLHPNARGQAEIRRALEDALS
ncbi:SGNH/GDSL hydrolase family protein [Kineosporia sp. NBRC 101677]|uniref:SGNH/GDSL hydrolase family protein n=1 Tax=Kineosporia sp. NBRC 101677 TaxID=3032197 RepID=UPI0025528D06|nr:SGNH/GDSL hydrolase family protein [Kineosporia sp. NBRC 101677]